MKNIYILITEDTILSSAAAPLDIFSRTNYVMSQLGRSPAFNVELVTTKNKNVQLGLPTQFNCQRTVAEVPPQSAGHNLPLIMVPAFGPDWDTVHAKSEAILHWLAQHYVAGTEIASLCVGSYYLAQAGILNGKTCTSHWRAIEDMRQRFPLVNVQGDYVVTDQDGVYSGGGAFSSLNLVLYLVEKFCGHDVGVMVSKNFSIHRDHINQAHFAVFRGLNQHQDNKVRSAQQFIEKQYTAEISIDQVAAQVNMSTRNLIRRFKQAVGYTPIEYIQLVRIESAKKQLENTSDNVQQIMYSTGYHDVKTFRKNFKRVTGVTPQAYRKKYGVLA